ncbi:uncharacterized protein CAP isoform X2 [Venturia canescens]|uniref:uncharacterized protein CAP isoform X2 n=1 Tax=Venturia canescens TaxID=32260 RepID=UPI001C9C9246|nr:uncharacterized protein LOC122410060 isoform X2 [Venturia canescens]
MPRPSRARKNRRNRNNKRSNNPQQKNECHDKSASTSDDRRDENSDVETTTEKESVATPRDITDSQKLEKLGIDHLENEDNQDSSKDRVEPTDNPGEKRLEAVELAAENPTPIGTNVNGRAIKVTTEESLPDGEQNSSLKRATINKLQARHGRKRLKVERRAINAETKIVEIKTLSGSSPLAASVGHVAGVGILETGGIAESDEANGTIVTISEPPEPIQPLPSTVASKVEGLMLGKREFDELTLLATASADNNNNDDEPSDGPEIHEVTDSDAETDNSINSRPTTAAVFIVEAESDVERDSVLDQRCHDTIAEESEDHEDETLLESEGFPDLDDVEISQEILDLGELRKDTEKLANQVNNANESTGHVNLDQNTFLRTDDSEKVIDTQHEVVEESVEQNGDITVRQGETKEKVPEPGDPGMLKKIPQEFQRGGSQTEEIKLTESIEAEIVESRSETLKNSVPEESCERQSGEKSPTISCPEILTSIAQDDGEVGNGKPEESVKSDENGVGEIGGRSSSVEDDSLEEKLDNRVPAKMGETSKDEYCDNLDNSSLVIEQKLSKVEEEVEATKSINEMNSFEEILHSGGTTETSKNFNESKVRAIPVEVEKPGDLSDSQMTKEVENKLRLYIEGLELPTFNDELQTIDHRGYEIERETNENSSQRRAKKRAILDSYYAEAKHADRFLDIIQEEGEKLSEGDERHIRDFINEEIGKFRREKRDARKPFESYELHEKTDQDPSIFPSSCRKNVNDCPPCIIEEKNDANIVTVRKTVENTHEIEKSTEESRIVVTKTLTKQENSKISETTINQRTIERLNDETRSDIRTRNNGISSGLSNGDEHSTSSRDAGPPIPPRRSSNFVPDSEPLEPPTPPSVDYPTELPEVPTLPAEVLIALQQPPVPPKRKRKIRGSIDVSPKRPPLPNSASQLSDRVTEENIYENIRQARRLAETEVNRDAPPLPPLPRDLQELEKRDAVLEGASENAIFLSNFERSMARYKAEKNEANLAELTTQMASSPENMQREHQRDHQLRNFRGVDAEATNSGYVAGNDARFEIASSVGNRSVYEENAAPMPPGAPLSSRKIAPPNFHHSDLARRRPELSDEHSRTSERCACEVDIIEKNKQIGGSVSDDEVGPGNLLGKGTKFEGFRDTTLRRHRREDSALVVDDKSSESSKAEASHRVTVVPVEKLWERSNLSDEVHSEDSEKSEYQKQDFFDTVTSVREERREEKRENSLDRSKSTNLASSFTKVTEYSINDSSVTFSEGKADSRVCVENNQAEKPTRPPRRLQHFSFSSSASPAPSQSFGSRRTETCSSQGQTNSVTTTEDKNCVDAEPRILPTLLVTNTLEKNFNSISPERNGLADDQESSSSGAATPNTVRLNSSNSFTDLASLELRGEPEKSDEPNASSETKLTRIYGEDEQRKFIDSPSSQDLYYVPLQNQNSHATRVKFKTGEDAQPGLLKDLCLRKILSLPYGLQIINEITLRKFNIFKNLQAIQESISEVAHPDHLRSDLVETQPGSDSPEEMKKQRPKTWMGIPTLGDSKLLVCLSPSQQTDQVRTSVDNLLDLHRKFLNRRSYHEDRRNEIDVPKYWIELDPETKGSSATTKSAQSREQRSPTSKSSPGNRLLEIIKENPLPSNEGGCEAAPKFSSIPEESSNEKNKTSEFHDVREDRLRATRLSDWLSLARKDPEDYTANRDQSKILSEGINENVESESGRCSKTSTRATRGSSIPGSSETGNSSDAVNTRDNVINNEYGKPENKRHQCRLPLASDATKARSSIEHSYEKIYNQVVSEIEQNSQQIGKRFGESGAPRENRVNSALIVKSTSAGSNEPHSSPTPTHPFDKCPISLKSAIIDKSSVTSNEASCKRTPLINWTRSNIDPRHNVNPALIDVKSDNREEHETSKSTRPIVVDRSCIDTTSIFNKTPPSSRLAPRKYPDPETLKHDTAADIIKNLKDLESNTRLYQNAQIDGRRRYSLPHECFDRQLRYIEQLENQLKEVILAEEEERKAFAEFQSHANRQKGQSMINLSETQQHFRDPFIEEKMNPQPGNSHGNGMKVASSDDSPGTRRESWHEESRTRQGDRSEFSKKEGHRETTKSVMDQGDLRVENSSTSYESLEEKQITSGGETLTLRESVARATGSEKKVPEPSFSEEKKAQGNDDNLEPKKSCHAKASRASSALAPNGEVFRRKMFDEYVHKVHEREERKQHKLVKISSHADNRESAVGFRKSPNVDRDMSQIEKEFIDRARNRLSRFGIKLDESSESELPNDEDNNQLKKTIVESSTASSSQKSVDKDDHGECETSAKCVIDGCEVRDPKCLPKHLQEFLELATSNDPVEDGVWSPGSEAPPPPKQPSPERGKNNEKDAGIPPIWTPSSAGTSPVAERKEFRPVAFESPVLSRKKYTSQISSTEAPPPWKDEDLKKEATHTVTHNITTRIVNSHSAPSQGLNTLAATPRLPRAQNPTITLLQKAREGQLPKGAAYLEDSEPSVSEINCHSSPQTEPTEYIYTVRREYESEPETTPERRKKMVNLGPRKIEGIGPTTKDGMPVALRSEVKETNQAKWYKKMYDSLHRADKDDDYITVRYKPRRGARYGYGSSSGYLSEPEPRGSSERSATLDNRRRQRNKENDFSTSTMPRKTVTVNNQSEIFRSQPGRIENYEPGRSSIAERETKEWWDEVMDIFDGWLDENGHVRNDQRVDNNGIVIPPLNMSHQASRVLSLSYRPDSKESPFDQRNSHTPKPYMSHALKESGYESDSTLIFRRRDDASPLSPLEQRLAYKTIQKGGDVPLHGLRKPAPERPKEYAIAPPPPPKAQHNRSERPESPRRYVEGEVTIHYRSPVRHEAKEILSEEELARRSAENMRRVYQEERRRKYLQELHDIDSRRHTDNFVPSQKSPIPLNRYDDFVDDLSYRSRSQEPTPEPRLVARALYNFVGQSSRELTFRRGDLIFVRRQVDKNWYEGEHNAMIGLFPFNYVEILPYDGTRTTPKKPYEGQARAKFNFVAQTNLELSLAKGELVVITRRVDENWYEGRIGNRKGIFPVSYVEVMAEPGHRSETPVLQSSKPVASPAAHSLLSNGTSGGKMSMGPHHYTPTMPVNTSTTQPHYNSLPRMGGNKLHVAPVNETLHIDTHSETIPYRALYNYRPQNEDELELKEGDTVYVMEKCDDGWYVGSSQRTGYFGTFPGNYVERLIHRLFELELLG